MMNFRRRDKKQETPPTRDHGEKLRPRRRDLAGLTVKAVLLLFVYWVVIIHHFERVRVRSAINACQWGNWEHWEGEKKSVTPHRIALIADPQLVDDHTYPKLPRIADYILRRLSDNYLYINHKYMQAYLDPDTTIFMGDLFDGGREWEDDVWMEELNRFNTIFPHKANRRSFRSLPGNHDIGFQNISYHNVKRFSAFFGEPNDFFELGNHTFIQLDTISYSHEDPVINQESRNFFQSLNSRISPEMPRILLTHVPLYRDPNVEKCGPGRESKRPFPLQRGVQYQTVIDYAYTEPFLTQLKPTIVFSGDDHDYCDVTHVDYKDNKKKLAREISCKTASMTNGIKYPAIHLLSLNNPYDPTPKSTLDGDKTYETYMCYLPSPYLGVKLYALSWLLSLGLILACTVYPEWVEQVIDRLRAQMLPHFRLSAVVLPDHVPDLNKRIGEFMIYSSSLFGCILFVWSIYNRM